jgi:hypothetical protein
VWGVLVFEVFGVFVWACWKQSRGEALRPWERRVTLAHLLALALVLGLAMAAGDWGHDEMRGHFPSVGESFDRAKAENDAATGVLPVAAAVAVGRAERDE